MICKLNPEILSLNRDTHELLHTILDGVDMDD